MYWKNKGANPALTLLNRLKTSPMINVLFFAQLREQLKTDQLQVEIATPCTVAQLQAKIVEQHPHWLAFFANRTLMVAINQTMVEPDACIASQDEVAFFPPVTGG